MKLSKEQKSQFRVGVFHSNLDLLQQRKRHLEGLGFTAHAFLGTASLRDGLNNSLPHILVFELSSLDLAVSEFVKAVLSASPETILIPIVEFAAVESMEAFRFYNCRGFVVAGPHLEIRLGWAVEEASAGLWRLYQNEQLFEMWKKSQSEWAPRAAANQSQLEVSRSSLAQQERLLQQEQEILLRHEDSLARWVRVFQNCEDRRVLWARALDEWRPHWRLLHLEWVGADRKLRLSSSYGISALDGLAGKMDLPLTESELANPKTWTQSWIPESLKKLFGELGVSQDSEHKGHSFGVFVREAFDSLLVFLPPEGVQLPPPSPLEAQVSLLGVYLERVEFEQLLRARAGRDPDTGLLRRETYFEKLQQEVERARRLDQPLVSMKIAIDHFDEMRSSVGAHRALQILRKFAAQLSQLVRANDHACRIEDSVFAVILPNCDQRFGAAKAERIRRLVESFEFPDFAGRVTVSIGFSVYPDLSPSVDQLDRDSQRGLQLVIDRGGNRVCLYVESKSEAPSPSP